MFNRPYRLGAAAISGVLIVVMASPVSAQLVVYDAATTARNTVTATVKQFLLEMERQQHTKLREMARRLSALTNLSKYALEEVPRWRTHGGDFFYAQPYSRRLSFKDIRQLAEAIKAPPRSWTPEKLWRALIDPEFTRRYWVETWQECEWKHGSPWRLMIPDGRVGDSGEVLEIEPCRRLVLSWRNEFKPEMRAEGYSRLTYELEKQGESVKLTLIHEINKLDSRLIEAVSGGWPVILASLKSLLETGQPIIIQVEQPR